MVGSCWYTYACPRGSDSFGSKNGDGSAGGFYCSSAEAPTGMKKQRHVSPQDTDGAVIYGTSRSSNRNADSEHRDSLAYLKTMLSSRPRLFSPCRGMVHHQRGRTRKLLHNLKGSTKEWKILGTTTPCLHSIGAATEYLYE